MPYIKQISITGFRGFTERQTLKLGVPNGNVGSGLTTIVGPNNSGKSSITEAIIAATQRTKPPFHVGQRNAEAGSKVKLEIELTSGDKKTVRTADAGGSLTVFEGNIPDLSFFPIPARRQFSSAFGAETTTREGYTNSIQHQANRQYGIPLHAQLNRIAADAAQKRSFDAILEELMAYTPAWTVDQHETGQNFLKYTVGKHSHSSDGLGDGIISLFSIAASLHDAAAETTVVIDEPELSLHPQFQRRVIRKLFATSATTQIIITTHSPLLIDWQAIAGGAQVVRVVRNEKGINTHVLTDGTKTLIKGLLTDLANPHVLGLDASEIFFYEDGVLMLEGQEDVLLLPEVAKQLDIKFRHAMFGWGVGGADKMHIVASILRDMGFERVAGLVDADKKATCEKLSKEFPDYSFYLLPADDIRTKDARKEKPGKDGVLDKGRKVRAELKEPVAKLLNDINGKLDAPGG